MTTSLIPHEDIPEKRPPFYVSYSLLKPLFQFIQEQFSTEHKVVLLTVFVACTFYKIQKQKEKGRTANL